MDELGHHSHHQRKSTHPPRLRHPRPTRPVGGLIVLLVVLVAAFVQTAPSHTLQQAKNAVLEAQPGLWHVTRVVDGDTINVTLGSRHETVRLLGIDTPETHDPRKPVQCFGEAAAAHTRTLLEGKHVRLEPDATDADRDKYHRLLRYVYLPDGTLVNAALIRDGYAFAYTIFPLTKLNDFRALEAQARQAGRGLWADCVIDQSQPIKQTAGPK